MKPGDPILMFIPKPLELEGRPELAAFPLNILFAKEGALDGKPVIGRALYEPDLSTLDCSAPQWEMLYRNRFGEDWSVRIVYDTEGKSWTGEKQVNGRNVCFSAGSSWNGFFQHLTMLGLKDGEACEFIGL